MKNVLKWPVFLWSGTWQSVSQWWWSMESRRLFVDSKIMRMTYMKNIHWKPASVEVLGIFKLLQKWWLTLDWCGIMQIFYLSGNLILYSKLWRLMIILNITVVKLLRKSVDNLGIIVITSAEEGDYVFGAVCLSVCLSVGLLANLWMDFDEILWRGRAWLKDQVIQFWWWSGSRFGSGSPKSEIRILQIGGGLCSLSILFSCLFCCNFVECIN